MADWDIKDTQPAPSGWDVVDHSAPASSAPAPSGFMGAVTDTLKSIPSDISRGLSQSMALFGPAAESEFDPEGKVSQAPTAEQIQNSAETSIAGQPFYKPQTEAGKVIGSGVSTMADPLSYLGPGGLPGKAGAAMLSGMGGELGGQITGSPWGALAGGMGGGLLAGFGAKAGNAISNAGRASKIPTTAELFDSADRRYTEARSLGVTYEPDKVGTMTDNILKELKEDGYRPNRSPSTYNALEELRGLADGESAPEFSDIEQVRKVLNRITNDRNPFGGGPTEDAGSARKAISHIDDFFGDPTNAVLRAGAGDEWNAARVATLANDARADWAAASGSGQIERAVLSGEHRAGATGSGANIENTTRQQIRQILDNPKRLKGFSADERQMMEQIVMGDVPRNSARLIGKLAATGIVSAAGTTYLASTLGLGPVGHLALPGIAYATKKAGEAMTRARVSKLLQSVRADSPLGRERNIPAASPSPALSPYAVRGGLGALPFAGGGQ